MKRIALIIISTLLALSCSRRPETTAPQVIQNAKLEVLQTVSVDDYYEAVGTVRAKNSSVIAARIMGSIVRFHVREGDTVRTGQTLLEIENRESGIHVQKAQAGVREANEALEEVDRSISAAEAAHSAARANESLASKTLKRYQTLFDRRSVSPQEFDEVRAKYEVAGAEADRSEKMLQATRARRKQVLARIDQAKSDVSDARVNAGYARVTSPMNGVVVSKNADVGYMATPGMPLLTIENNSHYQLEVAVEESRLGSIHLGDQAFIQIDAIGKEVNGTVEEIIPTTDPNSRSYSIKIRLPDILGSQLHSGLYGKARFSSGQRQTLTVPQTAIIQQGQLVGVFVVDQSGIARLRLIKPGKQYADRVEVLSGLGAGEQIVTQNLSTIRDGTRVRESPPGNDQAASVR